MSYDIDQLGGTVKVARMAGVAAPSVTAWRKRGIPPDRCPAIERNSGGKYTCEQLSSAVTWRRVPDPDWPWHPQGRPLIDVTRQAAPSAEQQETRHAA